MAKLGTIQEPTAKLVAPGLYLIKVKTVEDAGVSELYPDDGPQLKWVFTIERSLEAEPDEEQEESVGEELWQWTNQFLGTSRRGPSRLLAWSTALFGGEWPGDDYELDTDDLVGKRAKAQIEVVTTASGKQRTKIVSLLPYKPARKKAVEPADDDPF